MKKPDAAEEYGAYSLEEMHKSGVDFFVDGEEVSFAQAMEQTVKEDCSYMADYVLDCKGKVEQVRFDKINLL